MLARVHNTLMISTCRQIVKRGWLAVLGLKRGWLAVKGHQGVQSCMSMLSSWALLHRLM